MASTPKKEVPVSCFVCENNSRYYKLGGKKCADISKKISAITDCNFDEFLSSKTSISYGICRKCTSKIDSAFEVVEQLKNKIADNGQTQDVGQRFKRLPNSPITPNIQSRKIISKKSKTCRALDLCTVDNVSISYSSCADVVSANSDHCYQQPDVTVPQREHGYDACLPTNNSGNHKLSTVELLKKHLTLDITSSVSKSNHVIEEIVEVISTNQVLLKAVENKILCNVNDMCTTLTSRNVVFASVLSKYRSVENLVQHGEDFLNSIIQEISSRLPFVLNLLTMIVTGGKEPQENKVAPVAAAYAILMNGRCDQLSAWHRMTTLVAVKGQLNDLALKRLNHLSVTMSPSTKLRLLDEAGSCMDSGIIKQLADNPLVKVTGDNLDIYIRTGHKSIDKSNTDLHLFASNLIFSRLARPDLFSNSLSAKIDLERLTPDLFYLHGQHKEIVINSFVVLLGRILVDLKAFSWMRSVLPSHIHHPYQKEMSNKSHIFQLPILLKNEAKHEDCVDILDSYENMLVNLFEKAHGSDDNLVKFKVPVGGDQLTRVRLEEAKHLRMLSTSRTKRFDDLQPFVIELWHMKQDFLEKAYKELYDVRSLRQPGTIYNIKSKLQRSDVNGKVKGAFKPHHDLFLLIGRQMITEQFLDFFGMEQDCSEPTKNIPTAGIEKKSPGDKSQEMHEMLRNFISFYGYDKMMLKKQESSDEVYSYCSNLCHWALQLFQMDDIAKEGDINRLIPSLMHCVPFFFSHSRLSKYFVECLDFILKSEYLSSPLQRIRILEGAFINLRGGTGNNMESDLVQENSVRNQKDLIRALGANKTEKAIIRCSKAADTINKICEDIDLSVSVKKPSTRHQKPKGETDKAELSKSLRQLRPFQKVEGRKCNGHERIQDSPFMKINPDDLNYRIKQVITRLYWGQSVSEDAESDSDSDTDY